MILNASFLQQEAVEQFLASFAGSLRIKGLFRAALGVLRVINFLNAVSSLRAMLETDSSQSVNQQVSVPSDWRCEMGVEREIEPIVRVLIRKLHVVINGHVLGSLQVAKNSTYSYVELELILRVFRILQGFHTFAESRRISKVDLALHIYFIEKFTQFHLFVFFHVCMSSE